MNLQDFSGQYSLSKTIMTGLLPTDETLKNMKHAGLIESDRARQQNYKTVKRAIDHLHKNFISEALKTIVVEDSELEKYITIVTDKKSKKKEIETAAKPILKKIETAYKQTNDAWATAYELKKPFTSTPEAQLAVLRLRNDEVAKELQMSPQELAEMVSGFDGFSAYFSAYHLNRLNIYAPELKATSSANRALTNLVKFAKNREKFQKYYASKNILSAEYAYLFDIANYQKFLPQSGIDEYNLIIGELHSLINQERQAQNLSKKDRHQLPFLETLHKQILTETGKVFSFDQIKTKEDFAELIQNLQASLPDDLQTIKRHFANNVVTVTDPQAVFLNSRAINGLLYSQTNNAAFINNFLPESFGSRKKSAQTEDVVSSNFLSLHDLFAAIDQAQSQEDNSLINEAKTANPSAVVWKNFCADLCEKIDTAEACVADFAKLDKFGKQQQETIKKALDAYSDIYKMYTYFELRFKNEPVANLIGDEDFYAIFDEGKLFPVDKAERFSRSYDLARNWLTKKPYSLDKWVLKFDCGSLLGGWDLSQESIKHGSILKDSENNYYLLILTNEGNNLLDRDKNPSLFESPDGWEKMTYKLLPTPYRNLPRIFFSGKYRALKTIPKEIEKIKHDDEFKKGDNFNLASLHKLIDFYKDALATSPDWSKYTFNFRPTKQYESIDQFYFDVELGGYKLDFTPINYSVLEKAEKEGLLYIFQITNKDLKNPNCKKPNLHTLYFLEALKPDSNIKLNGEAEIFFRPKSLEPEYKKDDDGSFVLTPQGNKVIANRRFTQDRFELHLPLTLNRKVKSISNAAFNQHVAERIKTNGIDAIIGIDRGEKHLTYIAVVDKNGKLIREPISFNKIPTYANKEPKDYWKKLSDLEDARRKDRQNWEAVRKIKDIKDGYVGLCVKKVVDLMLEHNAVVALENLNIGFKQGRAKIERNTYSQFEQALLEKLQYVVKKDEPAHAIMGAQNGAQLTPPDVSPGATNNHMGFVFYVDPSYTSKIDPVSGYRQQFRVDERVIVSTFAQFISGFDDIYYKDDNLLFAFNWKKLATAYNKLGKLNKKQKDSVYPDHNWTITANVKRSVYKKRTQNQDEQMPTPNCQEELLALFAANGVSVQQNIKQQLTNKTFTSEFVKRFVYYFNLINSLRNEIDGQDAIISPVYPNGFDSTRNKLDGYNWDGDANGAYNIARKGVILLQKLKAAQTPKDFKCIVTREEYDQFVRM